MRLLATAALALCSAAVFAAQVDGAWKGEIQAAQKGKKKSGETAKAAVELTLRAADGKLTGSVTQPGGRRGRAIEIADGKIEGNRISFTTVQRSKKKGEQKVMWQGTVEGDTLTGTFTRDGARRGTPFTAKRVS